MLGMMNAPSDSIDFYASNPGKSDQKLSSDDTRAFTEPKDKPQTTYTQDGRMVVDGKAVDGKEATTLWSGVLLRSAVQQMPLVNEKKEDTEAKEENKEEITPINEPIITAARPVEKESVEEEIPQ